MKSIDIVEAKGAIANFMAGKNFPATIKKMIYQDLFLEAGREEDAELRRELAEREEAKEEA